MDIINFLKTTHNTRFSSMFQNSFQMDRMCDVFMLSQRHSWVLYF